MEKIKLITFDFEGTLVDFQWKLAEAEGEALKILTGKGLPGKIFSNTNYAVIYNLVREKGEEWGFPGNHLNSLIDSIYDTYDLDAASRWRPVHGLHDLLGLLKGEYKIALVSNVGKKGLNEALLKFGLENSFGLVVTRNDVQMLKPSGEGLLKAIEWARVRKENVIHIGDSLSDIYAARNTGVKTGIVLGGENKPEILLQEHPDIVLDKLAALPGALKSIGF
ncbi:MAG: HAD family hydrolase [Bacillota bacterium]